jgi:hypothetical protein
LFQCGREQVVGLGCVFGQESVAKDMGKHFLNMVGVDGVLLVQNGRSLRRPLQGKGAAC